MVKCLQTLNIQTLAGPPNLIRRRERYTDTEAIKLYRIGGFWIIIGYNYLISSEPFICQNTLICVRCEHIKGFHIVSPFIVGKNK